MPETRVIRSSRTIAASERAGRKPSAATVVAVVVVAEIVWLVVLFGVVVRFLL